MGQIKNIKLHIVTDIKGSTRMKLSTARSTSKKFICQPSRAGHNLKLRKTKATKLPRIHAFSNRVIDDWNELPAKAVNAPTTNSFKVELDRQWEDRMYNTPF